jgi:uncharacterized protein
MKSGIRWPRLGRMLLAIAVAGAVAASSATARAEVFVSLGTGELSGIYYPVGEAICHIVNRHIDTDGVRCSPETTPGSVYNIAALRSGELEFAIVQSDVQFEAYEGRGPWRDAPFRGLRAVASLYPELVTLMVQASSPIRNLLGLAGRQVNVGSRGSGTRATWDTIAAGLGWRDGEAVRPVELRGDEAKAALCRGTVDANLLIVGHPSPLVAAQAAACPVAFVAVAGTPIDELVRDHPYYRSGMIDGRLYGLSDQVPTFGVQATLVTSTSVSARVVGVVAKALLTHMAELRTMHPALAGLTEPALTRAGLTAPLDAGAAEIYKERESTESETSR